MKILELGNRIAPAFAGMLLQRMGAEVVRVDVSGASWRDADVAVSPDGAAYFAVLDAWLNTGKERVGFASWGDLRNALPALFATVDCVVEGLEHHERSVLGLDPVPAELVRPWVTVTPYGTTPAGGDESDLTAAALSGAIVAIGHPQREPLTLPHFSTSVQGGSIAALVALAAVMDTGPPRHIDVASAEVIASYASVNGTLFEWRREGHRAAASGGAYPYTLLPAKDGSVCLAVRSNAEWRRMREALGDPHWASDARFADVREIAREHAEEADERLIETLSCLTVEEVLDRGASFGCAMAPVRGVAELAGADDLRAAGVVRDVATAQGAYAFPFLTWFRQDARERSPLPGADNDIARQALEAAGLDASGLWQADPAPDAPRS